MRAHRGMTVRRGAYLLLAFVAVAALAPVAAASAPPGGEARAQNSILSVTVGSTSVSIGLDAVKSLWGTGRTASAEMLVGQAGDATIPGASRKATRKTDSGSSTIGAGAKTISGLASLDVASGSVTADVALDHVESAARLDIASVDLLTGLAQFGAASTATTTRVDTLRSKVSRTVELGQADVLSLGELFDRLGISPLALTCSALEDTGAVLGVDTADACEEQAAAEAALEGGTTALDDAKSDLETATAPFTPSQVDADEATVTGTTCASGDLACEAAALATLTTLNTSGGYGLDLTGLSFTDAKTALLSRFDEIQQSFADLATVDDAATDAAAGTCASVSGALRDVADGVTGLAPTMEPLAGAIDSSCDALADTVQALLDTSLLSLDTIEVSLETVATVGSPTAKVTGNLVSVRVGNVLPAGPTLSLTQADFTSSVSAVSDAVALALSKLAIGLQAPEIELMKTSTTKGKRSDGTWFASASLTALHLAIPSSTPTLPAENPLGFLGGTGGLSSAPVRAGAPAAPVTTPAVVIDAAKFTGSSTFVPGADGKTLPVTGVPDGPAGIALGLALIVAAAGVRRLMADH